MLTCRFADLLKARSIQWVDIGNVQLVFRDDRSPTGGKRAARPSRKLQNELAPVLSVLKRKQILGFSFQSLEVQGPAREPDAQEFGYQVAFERLAHQGAAVALLEQGFRHHLNSPGLCLFHISISTDSGMRSPEFLGCETQSMQVSTMISIEKKKTEMP